MEGIHVVGVLLPVRAGGKQVSEKIFHGSGLYQGKSAGVDDLRGVDMGDSV
jgi:hypothetical protein